MNQRTKIQLIKYGCTTVVSLLMTWATLYLYGIDSFWSKGLVEKYRILCDAFTVPGLLLVMAGLLMVVSNKGAFEGLGYAVKHAVMMLIPGVHEQERYYDYVQRKRANKAHGFGFLFVVGLIDLLFAGIFMALFYSLYS